MVELVVLLLSMCGSAVVGAVLLKFGKTLPLVDNPNERSSHTAPTMTGGGVAIVVVVALAAWLLWRFGDLPTIVLAAVLAGGLCVGGIGLVDDVLSLRPSVRLVVQSAACLIVIGLFHRSILQAAIVPSHPAAASLVIVGVFITMIWLLNLYNFMDGIDGLAGLEAVFVSLAAALLLEISGSASDLVLFFMAVGGACAGFLWLNWPPAKIFMGDVGSGFLGFLFASLALLTSVEGSLSIWTWSILLSVFLVDASITITVRLARGERIHQAHRSHAYQRAARRYGSHRLVTVVVGVIDVVWLLPLAWVTLIRPSWGMFAAVLAWLPLAVLAVWLGSGQGKD